MFATLTVQEKKQLLSFVIVGGGPTGVEVAAELQDMVETDLVKVYPDLIKDVRIAVIELQDHVLSTYDRRISDYTRQIFNRYVSHHIQQTHIGLHQTEIQPMCFRICCWRCVRMGVLHCGCQVSTGRGTLLY